MGAEPHLLLSSIRLIVPGAFGLLGTTKRGRGDGERNLWPATDKAKAERTGLQVNTVKQLAGSRGKIRFQTINHHSLLHNNNKDVAYSGAFTTNSIFY